MFSYKNDRSNTTTVHTERLVICGTQPAELSSPCHLRMRRQMAGQIGIKRCPRNRAGDLAINPMHQRVSMDTPVGERLESVFQQQLGRVASLAALQRPDSFPGRPSYCRTPKTKVEKTLRGQSVVDTNELVDGLAVEQEAQHERNNPITCAFTQDYEPRLWTRRKQIEETPIKALKARSGLFVCLPEQLEYPVEHNRIRPI